jgi:hypothetical protein
LVRTFHSATFATSFFASHLQWATIACGGGSQCTARLRLGVGLLAANLAQIDELGGPACLESGNRANDLREERLGLVQVGEFAAPCGGPTVACMWRDPW